MAWPPGSASPPSRLRASSPHPDAHADDFGLGDVLSDLVVSASTAELANHAVDQALTAGASGAETLSAAGLFQQYIYDPLHAGIESWINSSFGEQVEHLLNTASGQFLIGNGAEGSALDHNGGDGGLWFGDGGSGWDSDETGVAGGPAAMRWASSEAAGTGDWADVGADGGDGGDAGSLFGIGGDGGNAGAGATAAGLPALGGAGGNAGTFGEHGMVGDYGTLSAGPTQTQDLGGSLLPVGTTGDWLTNSDGQVVMLHGLNEVYKMAPGEPSAERVRRRRRGVSGRKRFQRSPSGRDLVGPGTRARRLRHRLICKSIEQTVQTLGSHGIYSIIDFHQDAYSTAFGGEGAPDWAVQTDGVANPSLPFPYNEFFNPAEQQAWESFWSNADASERNRSGKQLQPDVGVRRQCLQRQLQRGRIRAHERTVAGLIDVPVDLVRQPVLRQSAADPVLRPGGRRDPGGRSEHADFLRTQCPVQRGCAHRSGHSGRLEHGVVVPRLLRILPRPAGMHPERQRDRRQRRELRAGARDSGIHDRVRCHQRPSADPGARCRAPTST